MEHLSLEKKKRIALIATTIIGLILVGTYILIILSKEERVENTPRALFKEFYTTLIDTTQQYFSREK
jgi:hypothetical protein